LNPREAFKTLYYIGFGGKMHDVVTLIKYKETDRLKESGSKRKVYNAYVVSHHATSAQVKLLDSFTNDQNYIHANFSSADDAQGSTVNCSCGDNKYIIVSEFTE
jgi:hypothetical protein